MDRVVSGDVPVASSGLPANLLGSGTTPDPGHRKLATLEGIRGIAVLAVMATHFNRFLPAVGALVPLKRLFAYGWAGVDLFFVLSGFLITGILLQTRASPNYFSSFYARRVLRIFPIYYATLAVVFVAATYLPAGADRVPAPNERWLYFAYLSNWIAVWKRVAPPNVVGHFWSLGVEEQFYLLWPLAVFTCSRRVLGRVALALVVLALATRTLWVTLGGSNDGITLATTSRMDSLLLGAIAAMLFLRVDAGLRLPSLVPFAVVPLVSFVAGAVIFDGSMAFVQSVGFSLLALGFGAFILAAALDDAKPGPLQRLLRNPVFTRIGRYSYGMYVYHVPILGACELLLLSRIPAGLMRQTLFPVLYVMFLGVLTFVVAALSFELVERPILGLKRYFEPDVPHVNAPAGA